MTLPDADLARLGNVAKRLARGAKAALGCDGVNLLHASGACAQQTVFHFHLHIVPRYVGDAISAFPRPTYKEDDPQQTAAAIKRSI